MFYYNECQGFILLPLGNSSYACPTTKLTLLSSREFRVFQSGHCRLKEQIVFSSIRFCFFYFSRFCSRCSPPPKTFG